MSEPRKPSAIFGPVCVWNNESGPDKRFWSVTIKPRRYKNQDGEWQDASNYNVDDLAHISFCLAEALRWCLNNNPNVNF